MLQPVYTSAFAKDVSRIKKRGYNMDKLAVVMNLLLTNKRPLPQDYRDHPLKGKFEPKRELHIAPDWLLIYEIAGDQCCFARTGTHSDLTVARWKSLNIT